ncbi:MAG TPA: hypothetical protein VJ735_20890 [Actinomycetes bacterium]|nr:hypothetical protein [Actinomycetes bacterium]
MDEVLRIFVLGVEWFALWLEHSPFHVAWPVLFVALIQAFLSVVHVLQWYARGMFLRIACDYPVTTSKGSSPCKNKTLGEWHRCHQHRRRWLRRTDRHEVDPDLRRWQTIGRDGARMERADRYGEGMLRARSRSIGLLYYRGYARWPFDVKRLAPELIADYRIRWRELREQFRQWRSGERSEADSVVRQSGVAPLVATTREATKVALVAAAIGLLCVGLALILRENPSEKLSLRVTIEYYAALLFFLAVSVTHNGVWGERQKSTLVPHDDWLRRSVKETARVYGLAILCAWLLGTVGRSLGDIVEAIPYVVVWGGFGLLILAGVINEIEKAERRDRRRRSRRSRPRSNDLTAEIHTKARYAGRCASCGHPVRAGMRIGWVRGLGWCCSRCVL